MTNSDNVSKNRLFAHLAEHVEAPTVYFVNFPNDPELMQEVDEFRRQFEIATGTRTDVTKRYSTQLPTAIQEQMPIEEFYRQAPPFVRAWAEAKLRRAAAEGSLDDVPDKAIVLLANRARSRHI